MFYLLDINDGCGGLLPVVKIVYKAVNILHIVIPIVLIAYATMDLGKAVMASDEKKIKEAQGHLIKRIIFAILIFLVPYLVSLIVGLVSAADIDESQDEYVNCWEAAKN